MSRQRRQEADDGSLRYNRTPRTFSGPRRCKTEHSRLCCRLSMRFGLSPPHLPALLAVFVMARLAPEDSSATKICVSLG